MDGNNEQSQAQTCQFWIAKKKRLCKFEVTTGHIYCGNHVHLAQQEIGKGQAGEHVSAQQATTENGQARRNEGVQRVPCPADPHHTVPVSQLESHLKKCPAAKRQAAVQATPYYQLDINAGIEDDCESISPATTTNSSDNVSNNKQQSNNGADTSSLQASSPFTPGTAAYRSGLARAMGKQAFLSFLDRLVLAYTQVCGQQPPLSIHQPACADMESVQHPSVSVEKHARQGLSIIGNLLQLDLLPISRHCPPPTIPHHVDSNQKAAANNSDTTAANSQQQGSTEAATGSENCSFQLDPQGRQGNGVLVELGAGKAGLTALMATTIPRQHSGVHTAVMIDYKAGLKGKADRLMRNTVELHRVTIDLKDLKIHQLPALQPIQQNRHQEQLSPPWLVVAKHLCGAATDYALRACLRHAHGPSQTAQPEGHPSIDENIARSLKGIAIATCCHHRCGWKSYVGKPLFTHLGFTAREFEILSWMTGWALCGHDAAPGQLNEDGDEHTKQLPQQQHDQQEVEDKMKVDQQQPEQGPEQISSCRSLNDDGTQEGQVKRMRLSLDLCGQQKLRHAQPPSNAVVEQGLSQKHGSEHNLHPEEGSYEIEHSSVIVLDKKTPNNEWQDREWDPAKGLTRASKMRLGAMAKLLIDRGRLDWISAELGLMMQDTPSWQAQYEVLSTSGPCERTHRFACVRRYIDETVSGENKMILVRM